MKHSHNCLFACKFAFLFKIWYNLLVFNTRPSETYKQFRRETSEPNEGGNYMKKVMSVILFVVGIVLVFKFITSGFFLWMIFGAAVPQVIRYLCKEGVITKRGVYRNAYRYTVYVIIGLTLLRLILVHTIGFSLLIGGLIGVAISNMVLNRIE